MNDTAPSRNADTPLDENTRLSLDIAKHLAVAGVPIFLAEPGGDPVVGYQLPNDWQHTTPDPTVIDQWRPGMALCAVGGHEVDIIDVDPRNGGDETERVMRDNGSWPRTFGTATSPSGGRHYVITPLRVGKYQGKGTLTGIDVQGGRPDGTGRGFVFLAPTVRRSKTDGVPRAYRWVVPPNLDELAEWSAAGDDSGVMLADMIRGAQNATEDRPAAATGSPVDPFDPPPRIFTMDQAKEFIRPQLEAFRAMRTPEDSGFNDALNKLACLYSHFTPAFVSRESAERTLFDAATANRSVEFQGERKVRATIRSGLDQKHDPWKAHLPPDRAAAGPAEGDGPAAPDPLTALDSMLAEMLTADEIAALPNPEPLINGMLDMNSLAWLIGKPGSYKSFLALDFAGHVGQGRQWFGRRTRQGDCLYLVAEGTSGMTLRTRAWQSMYGQMAGVRFLPRPVQAKGPEWSVLVAAVERLKPALIVIDTQARVTVGINENDNTEIGLFIEQAEALRRVTGACVLVVHHIGRNGQDARGASALDGAQGTELRIERTEDMRARVVSDKQKDMAEQAPTDIALMRVEGGTDPETGRDLSSLVVSIPIEGATSMPRDWIDNLTENQTEVIGIVADHFPDMGATKPEIKRVTQERRKERGQPRMSDGSFGRVWDSLTQRHILLRVEPTQRYALNSLATRPLVPMDEGLS